MTRIATRSTAVPADPAEGAHALGDLPETPAVTYVMPVLNEEDYVAEAVASVLAQEYDGPKEIVLAIGPSQDRTQEVVAELAAADPRVQWVHNPAGTTPAGLNLAIRASSYPVVIRVDAHTVLEGDYTRRGVDVLRRTGAADVGGLMDARGRTPLQRAVAAAYHSPFGLGGAAYHSGAAEGEAESAYLGIFRREIFDLVGFYDESMLRAQDWELCFRIRSAGHKVWFAPELSSGYFPRSSFKKLAQQSYASGVWRGELARRHEQGKSTRHLFPPLVLAAVTGGTLAGLLRGTARRGSAARKMLDAASLAPIGYALGCVAAAFQAGRQLPLKEKGLLAAVLPTLHLPWAVGYLRGRARGAQGTRDQGRVKA